MFYLYCAFYLGFSFLILTGIVAVLQQTNYSLYCKCLRLFQDTNKVVFVLLLSFVTPLVIPFLLLGLFLYGLLHIA